MMTKLPNDSVTSIVEGSRSDGSSLGILNMSLPSKSETVPTAVNIALTMPATAPELTASAPEIVNIIYFGD